MDNNSLPDGLLFSVLMCAHRDDTFVLPAIESVLAQTDAAFELVIVLNACPDSLHQRLQQLRDPRIVLHRTAIGQLGFNLNFGLQLCRGEYVVRFDADDVCHPDRLRKTRALIQQNPGVDVVAGSCVKISETGEFLGRMDVGRVKNWRRTVNWRNPFVHPATSIRRARLLEMRGYSGGLRSEDYDLWLRMSERDDVSVVTTSFPMIDYRLSVHQTSGTRLGYAEVAGYLLRSMLVRPRWLRLVGLCAAITKTITRGRAD